MSSEDMKHFEMQSERRVMEESKKHRRGGNSVLDKNTRFTVIIDI
jgi:hypothetical protein